MNNFIEKLKTKEGASTIEFLNSMLIYIILFVSAIELFFLGYKYIAIGSLANNLVQVISIQGGIQESSPSGYETDSVKYVNTQDILNSAESIAKSMGQKKESLTIRVRYQKTQSDGTISHHDVTLKSNSNIKIEYGNWFEVTVQCNLENILTGELVPINTSLSTISRTKGGVSQFEFNYNNV